MSAYYVLDDLGRPMAVDDLLVWATWFENADQSRVVAQDVVDGRLFVSTIFLGLDHNFLMWGPPILWETMTFFHNGWTPGPAGVEDWAERYSNRYTSREDAEEGHRRAVAVSQRQLQEWDARHPAHEQEETEGHEEAG